MKIWHISDTHTFHGFLKVPEGIDLVIHSGDFSNPRDLIQSEQEVRDFLYWFAELPIKYKVCVAGNHDLSIEKRRVTKQDFEQAGIVYLENESTQVEGFNIWGSPITPNFGDGWAFNKGRDKISRVWDSIPDDTDIIISHGPPKGVLDLSFDGNGDLEFCGCGALGKRIKKINPMLVCFGHIHNMDGINNQGYTVLSNSKTIYSNGSVVWDGRFDKGPVNNGNVFELN